MYRKPDIQSEVVTAYRCVHLARLSCMVIRSNMKLNVAVKVYWRRDKVHKHLILNKKDYFT